MIESGAPGMGVAFVLLGCAVLFAAWHEYRSRNPRDAKVLTAMGAAGLIGGVAGILS